MTGAALALLVALAGGLGAGGRYTLDVTLGALATRAGRPGWVLAGINVTGSLLIGVLAGLATAGSLGAESQTILATGFLGGFTTFSAASLDVVEMEERSGRDSAVLRALVVPITAVAACALGFWLAGGF